MIFKINYSFVKSIHWIVFQAEIYHIYCETETEFYFGAKLMIYVFKKHGAVLNFK